MIYGNDVASYQGSDPDYTGLDFTIIKVTEGTGYVNPYWKRQRDKARSLGLVVGYYAYPHIADGGRADAEYFLANCLAETLPNEFWALDWEWYGQTVPGDAARQFKDDFLADLADRGHRRVTYSDLNNWRNVDRNANVGDGLWIATAGYPAGSPPISHPWLLHQYAVVGGVDMDVANFASRADLAAWATVNSPTPPPPPEVPLTPQEIADAVWHYQLPNVRKQPDGTWAEDGTAKDAYWWLVWQDVFHAQLLDAIAAAKLTPQQVVAALANGSLKIQVALS